MMTAMVYQLLSLLSHFWVQMMNWLHKSIQKVLELAEDSERILVYESKYYKLWSFSALRRIHCAMNTSQSRLQERKHNVYHRKQIPEIKVTSKNSRCSKASKGVS